ncbi:hypothetical protein C2G38_2104446 [Gigaspora rosea]|uniref:Uncharacterized protein n=1 Tax=Gigaspora rosea TaxID=44941 RepID=A0A397UV59_9GLOM|nr:hypothetical protein C2G38_2104446 [Gigaspora rosea]
MLSLLSLTLVSLLLCIMMYYHPFIICYYMPYYVLLSIVICFNIFKYSIYSE